MINTYIHGNNSYPVLVNCVCCLLNGEKQANINDKVTVSPNEWDTERLKDFIKQVRVRLLNVNLIPCRFQLGSKDNSLSGNPQDKDKQEPWTLYRRQTDEGMLLAGHSGVLVAKVEKNMVDNTKTDPGYGLAESELMQ